MHGMLIFLVVAYFLMNLAYSFKLKEIVLLDVFVIAAGFMLRVLGGAYAIGVQVSSWIVLCSMFISLFLGFAKRGLNSSISSCRRQSRRGAFCAFIVWTSWTRC